MVSFLSFAPFVVMIKSQNVGKQRTENNDIFVSIQNALSGRLF